MEMTQEFITQFNRKCAEFVGWKKFGDSFETPYEDASFINGEPTCICRVEYLRFHADWNWIMQVVEKIEELGNYVEFGTPNSVEIKFHMGVTVGEGCFIYSEISKKEAVVQAINQFIDWYNEHK